MQLELLRDGDGLTARPIGELDHHAAGEVREKIDTALLRQNIRVLRIDLSGLTFMDSSGLAVVLHLHRTCARSGREFSVRGTPPQPMRVFEAAGLPQVMVFERGED